MSRKEHDEQALFFSWVRANEHLDSRLSLIFAVPNQGKRSIGAYKYMLAEGFSPGVPDIIGLIPGKGCPFFGIEMKTPKGKPTDNQLSWRDRIRTVGGMWGVCRSGDEAIKFVKWYLEMEK